MAGVKSGNNSCLCCDIKDLKILGVGGLNNVGKKHQHHNSISQYTNIGLFLIKDQ